MTIFSPDNKAFESSNFDYKSVPIPELRRILMRHIVKGVVMLEDLKSGPVSWSISCFITAIKILKCLDHLKKYMPIAISFY